MLEGRDASTQTQLPGTIAVGNCSAGFELKSPSNVKKKFVVVKERERGQWNNTNIAHNYPLSELLNKVEPVRAH